VTARRGPSTAPLAPAPAPFGDRRRLRIGVLGGSFNPAHEGHLHISLEALKALKLHQVWWLVSPQNPLKPAKGMAPMQTRLGQARALITHPRIAATDLEGRLGVNRTALTLKRLKQRYPATDFVWLMGADNLAQMPRWWRWTGIFRTARVAVFDRSPYSYGALAGAAAQRFAQVRTRRPSAIWFRLPPVWTYVAIRRHPASATKLRAAARS
jgi:nicotinate-nucleotide adenylyltransferase